MKCLRCNNKMKDLGNKSLVDGDNWAFLGDFMHLFDDNVNLVMHACKKCGYVEFKMENEK